MIESGLKEPLLSPAAIFINDQGEIKVGEWEFISYFQQDSIEGSEEFVTNFQEEGQTFIDINLQSTIKQTKNIENYDILTKYYWPPEGIIQIQNTVKLGQLKKNQKLYEAKNSQIFGLGMTILHCLTLKPFYQKSTFSQKQLKKVIYSGTQIRKSMDQPLSQELIELLQKMLQWDPTERIKYNQILEFMQRAYQKNIKLFEDFESKVLSRKSSQAACFRDDDQTTVKGKYVSSMATQISVNLHQNKHNGNHENNCMQQLQQIYHQNSSQIKLEAESDEFSGSGLISQGLGDDYHPQIEDRNINKLQVHNFLLKQSVQDKQNQENNLVQQFNQSDQIQIPDEDIQLDIINSNQKKLQLVQHKITFEYQVANLQHKSQFFKQQNSFEQIIPILHNTSQTINLSYDLLRYNTIKNFSFESFQNFEKEKEKDENQSKKCQNLKKNISFGTNNNNYPESNEVNNSYKTHEFNKIIRQTLSPQKEEQFQQNQMNFNSKQSSSFQYKNQHLFTDPKLLTMIRQFTFKNNQETPNFQNIHISYHQMSQKFKQNFKDQISTKKLFQQSFDKCYIQDLGKQNKQEFETLSFQEKFQMVKEQFSKGLYEGQKKNGARNGYGTFFYKEGGKYSGYWYNNKMDGHGTLYYPDGRVAYEGQWKSDSLHGKGILYNEKPEKFVNEYNFMSFDQCEKMQCWIYYDGWFQNDEKCGFGQLMLSNGQKFVGEFQNDMVYGKGKFYQNNGSIFEGVWEDNQLID